MMKPSHPMTLLAVVWALVLCSSPRAKSDPSDPRTEAVIEAALRHQFTVWLDATERTSGTVLCLAIDPGGAPQSVDKEYLEHFRTEPAVRRAAECEAHTAGAMERTTHRPAILITAGPVEWITDDDAWVTVTHFKTRIESGIRIYRVVQEQGRWVSLGQVIRESPG